MKNTKWLFMATPLAVAAYCLEQVFAYTWYLNNIAYFSIPETVFRVSATLLVLVTGASALWAWRRPRKWLFIPWSAAHGFWLVNVVCTVALAARFKGYAPGLVTACGILLPVLILSLANLRERRLLAPHTLALATASGAVLFAPAVIVAVSASWLFVTVCFG